MPNEVENVLNKHPKVSQAHVVGISDAKMGEVGCACIIKADDAAPTAAELIDFCRENLARFKVPKHVVFLQEDQIPMTATGRVQKFKLADRLTRDLPDQPR